MQANTFWNCPFQYGNSACGINIRQGIAHMVDKTIFASQDPNIPAGTGTAIDNPLPTTSGGNLLSPNSCGWDSMFPETNTTGAPCTVGGGTAGTSIGGGAYHLATATGVSSISCPWCQAPGSLDLNAAAAHFVAAGLATGYNPSTSVLTGVISTTGITIPNFFIRNDDPARLDLGTSLEEQICYLFTGSYTVPCAYLSVLSGPVQEFPGFQTGTANINYRWWFYTAAYSGVTFYDDSLYYNYNSGFVSASCASPGTSSCTTQQVGGGYCSNASVQTAAASNYMYICSPTYDTLSTGLETSPCLSAAGDPVAGATSNKPTGPGNGLCTGTSTLSSHSAGIQAESYFGQNVLTLPFFQLKIQFGYLECGVGQPMSTSCNSSNTWQRIINNAGLGLPNSFTWLNAYNPSPATPGTIRQAFSQTTHNVSPYLASTPQDTYVMRSVYDSLFAPNPLAPSQSIYWMVSNAVQLGNNELVYTPPPSTVTTYRFTLGGVYFQDGRPVTAFDVAFSYLSMVATGAYLGSVAASMTGITILSPYQFDISVNSLGPFVLPSLASIPILPGRYWTIAGSSAWDSAMASINKDCTGSFLTSTCFPTQLTLSTTGGSTPTVSVCTVSCIFPAIISPTLMTINPTYVSASFDPIANHMLIGTGPWQCGTVTSSGSGICTPTGAGNGQTSYTLNANTNYFRSTSTLAHWIWASNQNPTGPNLVVVDEVETCYNLAVNLAGPCGHWQQGIGNPGSGTPVSISTISGVDALYAFNFVAPFNWGTSPPLGMASLPPVLFALQAFDGSTILTPAPTTGSPCNAANTYYNC
jgi:hypothetical protein